MNPRQVNAIASPRTRPLPFRRLTLAALLFLAGLSDHSRAQSTWPRLRGPNGQGIADSASRLPIRFDEPRNLVWQTELSTGHSSPVVIGSLIFLTGDRDGQLETVCLDRHTGDIRWRRSAPEKPAERVHKINSLASPSATVDEDRVYTYFGSFGLLCYDHDGNELWVRPLKERRRNTFGVASSLAKIGGLLIFTYENQSDSFIEAINPQTGDVVWHKPRPGFGSSWSTPVRLSNNGTDELLVYGVSWLTALDLEDGSDRWSVPGLADEPAITPALGGGLVYVTSYNMNSNTEVIGLPAYAELLEQLDSDSDGQISFEEGKANKSVLSRFDADGEGDHPLRLFYRMLDANQDKQISATEYTRLAKWLGSFEQENGLLAIRPPSAPGEKATVVWKHRTGIPEIPSPLYHANRIYLVKNGGIATCLDAGTGEMKYQKRLGSGGPYYASPVIAGNRIYAASARGMITVFEAGDDLKVLARTRAGNRVMATPAIVDGTIYIRTGDKLLAFRLPDAG